MPNHPCPYEMRIRRYLRGESGSGELGRLGEHLKECVRCQAVVRSGGEATEGSRRALEESFSTRAENDATRRDQREDWPTRAGTSDSASAVNVGSALRIEQEEKERLARGTAVHYFGDYAIEKELGKGGMGVVYRARQVSLNRTVALKMIRAGVLAHDADLQRFQNEAEAVALLDHSGIVPIYEVGDHKGQRYFSMKLVEGGNLAEKLASYKDDPRAAAALMIEIAEAVLHAHMRGILHRDLKPANILIDTQGRPHVTDFGLAKRIEGDVEMTASGAVLGTPAYMSPEQALGQRGSITTATDVYGLGAILYALLTARAPFGGDSMIDTLDAVRNLPPQPPTKLNARVPRDLELICLKCLEKNPTDRYASARTLADDLRRFLAGEPVSVRAAGAIERAAKWARRKPTLATAYALGLMTLVLGGLGGTAVWQWRVAERARETSSKALTGEAKARHESDQLREKVERIEYGRTMELARFSHRGNGIGLPSVP